MKDLLDIFDDEIVNEQIANVTPDPPKKNKAELQEDLLIKYMEDYGITNDYIKAAMMGIIVNEGGFSGKPENLYYTTPGRLAEVWSVFSNYKNSKGQTVRAPEGQGKKYANELAKSGKYLKNPQALGNFVYAATAGNEGGNDGYRYRGRGLNQLTGKGAYKRLGEALGVDLVNNPELLETDPDLQAKAAVHFLHNRLAKELPRLTSKYDRYKKRFGNYVDFNNIDNIEDANFILTSANAGFGKKPKQKTFTDRLAIAKKYETKFVQPERWQDEFEVDPQELAANLEQQKTEVESTSSSRPIPEMPKIGNSYNADIDDPQLNSDNDISPLPVNIPESVNTIPPNLSSPETKFINSNVQNFSKKELKQQEAYKKMMSESIMKNSAIPQFGQRSMFGQGQLFGADKKRTGGSINIKPENKGKFTAKANSAGMGVQAFANKVLGASEGTYSPSTRRQANFARNASKWNRYGGSMYPKYYNNGGPINPIKFNVDAETGNLKIYDPQTNTFKVTNVPYEGDTTDMQSHIGERFLGTDNKSREAVYGQLKMAQDFFELEKERADVGRQQLAERTDMLIDKKGKDFLPSTTYNFLAGNGGRSGCMAGSSGCFEPTEEQLQDSSYKSELTVPYFLKSKDDRYVKQILPFKSTAPEGFAQTYRNTEFRPNIFPTARVKNPNFGKLNQLTGNVDNREYITRTASKGNTRSEGSRQTPGGVLPTITGSATYIAQYPKLGMDEVAPGETVESGDRITSGGRKGQYYNENLQRYVTSDEIRRAGMDNSHHNYGIGTETGYSDYLDEKGNPIKEFNVGAIGGNILYSPSFKRQPHGPDSAANYSGSGNLVTRYKGDTDYYENIKKEIQSNLGVSEEKAKQIIQQYENPIEISRLPIMPSTQMSRLPEQLPSEITRQIRNRPYATGGKLGSAPCPQGKIYDELVGCISYNEWAKRNPALNVKDAKAENEEYYQANEWFKKYYDSPKYKEMVRSSYPEGVKGDLSSYLLQNLRKEKLSSTPPLMLKPQPYSGLGGESFNRTGQIMVYPEGYGLGTSLHELSHSSDRPLSFDEEGRRLMPTSDKEYIKKRRADVLGDSREYFNYKSYYDDMIENNPEGFKQAQEEFLNWSNYVGEDTETRARLNTIRKEAQDQGIYDPFTQGVSSDLYYKKLKKLQLRGKNPKKKSYNPMKQLQDTFSDEEIIWMLNNISENKTNNTDDNEGMA